MVYTRLNITVILHGVIKQTSRLIPCILKPNKINHALTLSNAWTIKETIRLTSIYTPSGDITSIKSCYSVLRH